jgi:hypothetical protein
LNALPSDWIDNVFTSSWGDPYIHLFQNMEYETARHMCETLTRYKRLQDALSLMSLEIRGDSRLCEDYVMSEEGDINHIVSVMQEMSFFYKQTQYPSYVRSLNIIRVFSLYHVGQ